MAQRTGGLTVAHIEDRWYKVIADANGKQSRVKTELFGKGMRYRVRYIAPDGRERSKSFPDRAKNAAESFMVEVESRELHGSYLDPKAGRMTFAEYARSWLAHQTFDESTREVTERRLRRHILPYLGAHELAAIKPTHVRELDRKLQAAGLSASFRAVVFANVAMVLNAAVDDERIAKNPCHARTVRPPRVDASKVIPWTRERVLGVRAEIAERYAVAVDLGAGCGMRQGEILALAVDDIDRERGVIHVVRQMKIVGNRLVFALPKGRKTRDVPLPMSVADRLAEHLERHPPVSVVLPWEVPTGRAVSADLIIIGKTGVPLDRHTFNRYAWWPAATAAGVPKERESGMHALRHFYASSCSTAGSRSRLWPPTSGTLTRDSLSGPTRTSCRAARNGLAGRSTGCSSARCLTAWRRPDHGGMWQNAWSTR